LNKKIILLKNILKRPTTWWCLSAFFHLLVQSVDGGGVVLELVGDVLVLLEQRLHVGLVLADVVGRHEPQDIEHPRVHVVGVRQELVEVHGLRQPLLPVQVTTKKTA
jgi:hypothetical protein